jgi:hypothetical protein
MKKINGQILYGAGETIHTILFNADVDTTNKKVGNIKLEMPSGFLDDLLQNVYKESESEALRLAGS